MAEPVRQVTVEGRVTVLRAAVAANPLVIGLRVNLAELLMSLARFNEVIELVRQWPDAERSYLAQLTLATCRLAPHDSLGDGDARIAVARAVELASSVRERAAALALRAKTERRLGECDAARATLVEALALNPANVDACKRLAAILMSSGDEPGVMSLTDDLLNRGIAHPQVLNARAVAQARLGQLGAARETVGLDRFLHSMELDSPASYGDIAEFNAFVAEELAAHPARRVDPHGSASRATVRVDAPTSGRAPLAALLMEQITKAVDAYVALLPDDAHPWPRTRPPRGVVHGTCAITGADGFETWHIHQQGWLSGVYYVEVPDHVVYGTDRAGCISFGLDDAFAGAEAATSYGETLIRPSPGMLMLFPSHCYHRTFPHGGAGRRICMAFDLWPG